MSVPATRSLEAVLRGALRPTPGLLRILVGVYSSSPSADSRYANIVLDGAELTVPNLNGAAPGSAGTPAYVLADGSRMWVLGTVTTGGPVAGGPALITKPGPPSAADGSNGDTYLDSTSLRFYGPKAAGAWPATPLGRLMPLTPTYAQLKSG